MGEPYTDLIARLEAATGPDRELDARLWCALAMQGAKYQDHNPAYGREDLTQVVFTVPPKRTRCVTRERGGPDLHAPALTASIDASLALVWKTLKGVRVETTSKRPNGLPAYACARLLEGRNRSTRELACIEHESGELPLAILSALLTALSEEP